MLVRHLQLGGMSPRRRGAGRGGAGNRELENLRRRIEELENRRNGDDEVYSEPEEEIEDERDGDERDPTTRLISYLSNRGSAKVEVSCYDGSLRDDVLIDWIGELERYFEYENVQDPNRVRFVVTKLKGHATLWWDMLQKDRVNNQLEKIRTWKKMVTKVKEKFLPCRLPTEFVLTSPEPQTKGDICS
jgi:hypothetical protein